MTRTPTRSDGGGQPELTALVLGGTAFPFHSIDEMGPHIEAALEAAGIDPETTTDRERLAGLPESSFDVVVDYTTDSAMTDEQLSGLRSFVASGGGYAGVHCAADLTSAVPEDPEDVLDQRDEPLAELRELVGGYFRTHPEQGAFDVNVVDSHHPVTVGLSDFRVYDEPYDVATDDVRVLARMDHPELGDTPVAWVSTVGDGRVFYTSLGHTPTSFEGGARELLGRGVRWAGRA